MSDPICNDLLVDIFARLPPKSLVRFRSLSKSLCSCIDSPAFRRLHALKSSQKVMIIHDLYNKKEKHHQHFYTVPSKEELPLCWTHGYKGIKPFKVPFRDSVICGSCNGIFCLVQIWKGIYLWNPSIKRRVILPDLPSWDCSRLFGFGYDPITDDYKVVVISSHHSRSSFFYSMKTCTWCDIGPPSGYYICRKCPSRACFFKGALHWGVKRRSNVEIMQTILTFDLSTNELGQMVLPESPEPFGTLPGQLTVIEGCLAMISTDYIWVMREYNNEASWCRVFELPKAQFKGIWTIWPFTVNGELVVHHDVEGKGISTGITTYNLKSQRLFQSRLLDLYFFSRTIGMEVFVESLELLNTGTAACEEYEPSLPIEGERGNQTTRTLSQYYFDRFRDSLYRTTDYICEDLMVEILSRLAPKPLLRFRSVSKSLCSCIDSPSFVHLQTLRSSTKLVLIRHMYIDQKDHPWFYTLHPQNEMPLCPQTGYSDIKPVKYPFSYSHITIGSCNGIFCLVDLLKGIYLWNPLIRRIVKVHDPPCWSLMDLYGFGFDPIVDDYKIVKISFSLKTRCTSFVYAIKTGIWSEIASPASFYSEEVTRPCFLNGALHWMVKKYIVKNHKTKGYLKILTFNLSTHDLGEIEVPNHIFESGQLTIIKGCLAIVNHYCSIWVMREYNDHTSWCRFFYPELKIRDSQVLPFTTDDNDLLIKNLCEGITLYNLDTRVQLRLADFNASSTIINTEIFVESLGLLNIRTTYEENKLSYWKKMRNQIKKFIFGMET